jgi:hypothetical protein
LITRPSPSKQTALVIVPQFIQAPTLAAEIWMTEKDGNRIASSHQERGAGLQIIHIMEAALMVL